MFTILSADGTLGMRLAGPDRDAFLATYGTGLYQAHGTVMKEYVAVPARLLARTAELAPYLAKSYDYAKSLKPKPNITAAVNAPACQPAPRHEMAWRRPSGSWPLPLTPGRLSGTASTGRTSSCPVHLSALPARRLL